MSIRINRKLAITLLFSLAILLALARPSSANAISPDSPHRRGHPNLNRMIKIRAAAHGNNPRAISATPPPSAPSTPSSPSQSPSVSPTSQPSLSSASFTSSPTDLSVSSTFSRSSASSTSSSAVALTTTSPTSSTPPPSTTDTPTSSTQRGSLPTAISGSSASVDSVTLTSHVPAASSSSGNNTQIGASSLSHTTITILIVLAASIGGCAIIWTIIRKWKFRPSAQFEDRLEPVNWQPTEHDSGLPTHRRMPSNASSFHSAGHDNIMGLSRSNSGGAYNADRSLTPLPDHDFTAGAATLAPGGGYADLARGPSPQPQMQEALQRGPSVNRGYEHYPAPDLQYQGVHGVQEAYDYDNAGPRY